MSLMLPTPTLPTRARSLLSTVVPQGSARWVARFCSGVWPVVAACGAMGA